MTSVAVLAARQRVAASVAAQGRREPLASAVRFLVNGRLPEAERFVREALAQEPANVAALCVLADIAARVGIYAEAAVLLWRVVGLAPDFAEAKVQLAQSLFQLNDPHAFDLLEDVLAVDPDDRGARLTELRLLGELGDYDLARTRFEAALARAPHDRDLIVGYANLLKTIGDPGQSAARFRSVIARDPSDGEAWWGIANLKTAPIADEELATLDAQCARTDLADATRAQLLFARGKAREDSADFAAAFASYDAANRMQRALDPYDGVAQSAEVDRATALFTPAFLAAHAAAGAPSDAPIFVVGMPRAGSTLIEQILASHSQVEGTAELPDIPLLVHRLLAERWRDPAVSYPDVLRTLPEGTLRKFGETYLAAARQHRKSDAPRFIDKLPNNWAHVFFIKLILPQARIVDARRGAMACCFANYKQYFARGQTFSYDLADLGRYYYDYVRTMAHADAVMPGAIHRVQHEALVADPEGETRRLLAALDLPFEEACLRFHENRRPVRTASAEQVRRPITSEGVDRWRAFEPWLGPLRTALDDLAEQ